MSKKTSTKKITSIGGSALIEGIMMRGPKRTTVCVRTGEDEIYKEDISINTIPSKCALFRLPFFRGIAGLIDSMRLSYKSLMLSADKAVEAGEIEEEEPTKFEKWLDDKFGDNLVKIVMVFASIIGIAFAVFLFFFLPSFLFDLSSNVVPAFKEDNSDMVVLWKSIFEGVLKLILFLGYIIIVSQTTQMKRVFMYHGAEHKTIFCYENEEELTVENVRKQIRFHPRCGTSFMVIMLIIGILIGLFVPVAPFGIGFLRPVFKILLLPVSCGIGYELIKICGRHDNLATRIIAAPGLWAQRITTKEPDDKMIEVAIEAIKEVIPDDGSDILSK
ncbi:DUF1385 domain-containing protein [Ruminococcus sp. YE282]|jgi:uncharacterized protein YqhQ|uniref:DUF1385 domain-containing protein n=1 Tax=Ruminococcus sp. YE282 TaxID=3158780 RepID=UPI0008901FBD|nr:DUF1385 domain-containing protein [Ruminococcus bromii]MDY4085080.1 DUF1385 domain-containing protein [Ruminococcus bromii]MDY4710682.1 DUF1385 domain-containing protein [Ruminococcus bromii]MEE0965355.1 DUF1385 domain-containing protein [Ruminococcus bromii]MEE3497565.1 DUF1385 domain-containing protein [Ruminococcus bromii]